MNYAVELNSFTQHRNKIQPKLLYFSTKTPKTRKINIDSETGKKKQNKRTEVNEKTAATETR